SSEARGDLLRTRLSVRVEVRVTTDSLRGFRRRDRSSLMPFTDVSPPSGDTISIKDGVLQVPDNPILPFIRGDGTGPDIWHASQLVFDAAVEKAYGGRRKVAWFEVFAGET